MRRLQKVLSFSFTLLLTIFFGVTFRLMQLETFYLQSVRKASSLSLNACYQVALRLAGFDGYTTSEGPISDFDFAWKK